MKKAGNCLVLGARWGVFVVAIVFLSLLIGDLGSGLNWAFGITGLLSSLSSRFIRFGDFAAVLFLKGR
jgi:ABC-type branched-subunit amino acid transport system permease subunit